MTPEKKSNIEKLASIVQRRRDHLFGLGMVNIAGKSPEKLEELSKLVGVAEAELLEAEANLRAAQQP